MSDLTEKWKNRELEDREYYIKSNKGDTYIDICADGNFMFTNYRSIEEVLAPVPSYAEYMCLVDYKEELTKACKMRDKIIKKYEDIDSWWQAENQKLKAQIAKLTEIVGVLPSNHSVGNLGYKIKNQRNEINNRLKEIDKLKELLKECRDVAEFVKTIVNKHKWFDEVITKIDEVLK